MILGSASFGVLFITLASLGIPLGVPPAPENPAMQYVAPQECVLYATWTAMAAPDGQSANHTEQLLAEPEVQAFAQSLDKSLGQLSRQLETNAQADPQVKQVANVAQLWARTAATRSSAIFVSRLAMVENKLDMVGGLIFEAGDQGPALVAGMTKLLATPEHPAQAITIGTLSFQRFAPQAEGPFQYEITLGTAGQYVLVGIGKDAVEGMVQRIREKKTPQWLTDLQKRLPVERRASMSYLNTKLLVDTFLPLAGPQGTAIAESLGVKQLGAVESVSGLDQQGILTRTFMKIEGPSRGLLTVFDGAGITPEKVGFIPKDATLAMASSLNTLRVYNVVAQLLAEHAPPEATHQFEQFEANFEQQFGMRLDKDVLASLGDTWTLWMSPADGWLGATASVEVTDREKITALLTRIRGMLGDAPPGRRTPRIETSTFGDHTIYMLAIPEMPFRPALAVTESRLIVSFSPQSIKAALDARPNEVGLMNGKAFANAFTGEGQVVAVGYQDSARLFETSYSYVLLLGPMMLDAMRKENPGFAVPFDLASLPSARSIYRHLQPGVTVTRRTKDGLETESRQTLPMPSIGTSAPVAVALLLPAVQAAREASRRMQSSNNLKQIGLAMHNHHDTFRSFPPAYSTDKDGKPLLSWRVHVLPFIEQQALYEQFKLDEPWDSEHNKKLIPLMPQVYRSPNSTAAPGSTIYLAVGGPHGIISKPAKNPSDGKTGGVSFAQILDGTSNTIMTVEASDALATPWTKPDEFIPNEKDPLKGLTGLRAGGFLAGLTDGSIRFITDKIDQKLLNNLFNRDDGNAVNFPGER